MSKQRSAAQKRADKTYDLKRPAPVPIRLTHEEITRLDQARGDMSRSAYIKLALEKMLTKQ